MKFKAERDRAYHQDRRKKTIEWFDLAQEMQRTIRHEKGLTNIAFPKRLVEHAGPRIPTQDLPDDAMDISIDASSEGL